ncbi:DUF4307 domain-containing protein [Dermabacteraceae bacterium P13115]
METLPAHLQDRYGTSVSITGKRLRLAGIVALGVLFLAAVLWVAWSVSSPDVRSKMVSYQHVSDTEMRLEFQVSRAPGTVLSCAVQALDSHRAQVGFANVPVPASDSRDSLVSADVTTVGGAVSAEVMRCEPQK